jgi:phage terminase small subunit
MAKTGRKAGKLTDLQKKFIKEYLIDLNITAAALRAGYSEKTAYSIGQETFNKPHIQAAIQKETNKRARRTEITADKVLEEYAKLGFSDVSDYLEVVTERVLVDRTAEGEPISEIKQFVFMKNTADIPPEKLAAISEVKQHKDGSISFKLHDKRGALDSIARHLGMFTERIEHTGKDGGPIQTAVDLSGLTIEELRNLANLDADAKKDDS